MSRSGGNCGKRLRKGQKEMHCRQAYGSTLIRRNYNQIGNIYPCCKSLQIDSCKLPVEKRLQKTSGGNRVLLLLFPLVREPFPRALPIGKRLLRGEAAEPFIHKDHG